MPRGRLRVVAVGDAIVDLVTPPIPSLPRGDSQLQVPRISLLPGGNATNFALQMAALGAATTLLACVGRDPFADLLRKAYREAGVAAKLRVDPSRPTGTTSAITWADGSRALVTALGANAGLRERDVSSSALESAGHVHRAGFWWTPGLLGAPTARILRRARHAGAGTSLDVSTDPEGWPERRVAAVLAALPFTDTFFGDEVEICGVAGRRDPIDAAARLLDLGAGEVVLHRAGRGSAFVAEGKHVEAPAFSVSIDNPTGCGDVFNAGFVYARLSRATPAEALALGNACAALHLADRTRPYPGLRDVRRFLRRGV